MANDHLVEGPWGKYTFHKVRPEDVDKVVQHIKDYFVKDEPTGALFGYSEEYGEEFAAYTRGFILEGLSFWVEDNETGDVAAVRTTYRRTRDFNFSGVTMNSRPLKELKRLSDLCHEGHDVFTLYDVEEYASFSAASCATKYRRQGLVTELYKRSIQFLTAEGFKLIKCMFTSPYSRAAAIKAGFEEISRVYHKDVRDEDGNLVYDPRSLTEEHYASLMCKKL